MRLYSRQYCSLTLFYNNVFCMRCRSELGYWAETDALCVLEPLQGEPAHFTSWAVPALRRAFPRTSRHARG